MLIRSQNRGLLIKMEGALIKSIMDFEDKWFKEMHVGIVDMGEKHLLGKYETEKRAIEVLDEIQRQLQFASSEDEIIGGVRVQREIVFEMPER